MQRRTEHELDALLERLNHQSVVKHYDAFADVAWDDPAHAIDPRDPRWALEETDPLGATEWYQTRPEDERARIGLSALLCHAKVGVEFERVLQRGLLELAATLPDGSPAFRYAYHEVIEEGQHSLMFAELIRRAKAVDPDLVACGMNGWVRFGAERVPRLGRTFPELFFLHVLAGEAPIDHLQREALARRERLHPLVRRIMQLHVTEEARHVCFARQVLLEQVPKLSSTRRATLAVMTPFVLASTAQVMLEPPPALLKAYGAPTGLGRSLRRSDAHRRRTLAGLEVVRELSVELGLLGPRTLPLWRWLGIA